MRHLMLCLALLSSGLTAAQVPLATRLKGATELVNDFPKPGVPFMDIGPLLADGELFHELIEHLAHRYEAQEIEAVVALEARGFLFGAALAHELHLPLIPLRKQGKLPGKTLAKAYEKEYGPDTLEIQSGRLKPNQRVLVIDDILATGGTARAACELVHLSGAKVAEVACIFEIPGLNGKNHLPAPVHIVVPAS